MCTQFSPAKRIIYWDSTTKKKFFNAANAVAAEQFCILLYIAVSLVDWFHLYVL